MLFQTPSVWADSPSSLSLHSGETRLLGDIAAAAGFNSIFVSQKL